MVSKDLKCLQIHIPKTGGLTIRKTLFNEVEDRWIHTVPDHPRNKQYWDDDYFKFTFVRNPFDKMVSAYLFTLKKDSDKALYTRIKKFKDFNEFIKQLDNRSYGSLLLKTVRFRLQVDYFLKGYDYDFVGRFENLQEDFNKVCDTINMEQIELPHINRSQVDKKHYTEYYNDESIDIVSKLYKEDIDFLKYRFGD